jgi:hypothetical protein
MQNPAPVYAPMPVQQTPVIVNPAPAPVVEKKTETPVLNKKNEIPAQPKKVDNNKKNDDA